MSDEEIKYFQLYKQINEFLIPIKEKMKELAQGEHYHLTWEIIGELNMLPDTIAQLLSGTERNQNQIDQKDL